MTKLKVISIKEPWASLIINGYKKYEFRSWKTNYRGLVLIHASKGTDKEASKFTSLNLDYQNGFIIGEAVITDCIPVTEEFELDLVKENALVYESAVGRGGYAWKLDNIKIYNKKIPVKGKLGLWEYKG